MKRNIIAGFLIGMVLYASPAHAVSNHSLCEALARMEGQMALARDRGVSVTDALHIVYRNSRNTPELYVIVAPIVVEIFATPSATPMEVYAMGFQGCMEKNVTMTAPDVAAPAPSDEGDNTLEISPER